MKSDVSCQSDVVWKFKIPIELQSLDFMLLEPVNGILCICGPLKSHVSYAYLWNPLTNEFKALPRPIVHMGYVADNFGFGFVPNSNDYKVVRVLQHERKHDAWIEIYSLNCNSWRRVRDSCSSSEITGNESEGSLNRYVGSFSVFRDLRHFPGDGDLTVDLEKEVITEVDYK
ncbi:putative F-box protein At3g16210 [Lycium barbarum]|uniref:putative F-box protein At3g16210 n=1 Tax=Lycium barbarum TaxID=112863 RepID=UPI00293E972A|nr:putative F-box protein At3g16210 [Lycium barbarum]